MQFGSALMCRRLGGTRSLLASSPVLLFLLSVVSVVPSLLHPFPLSMQSLLCSFSMSPPLRPTCCPQLPITPGMDKRCTTVRCICQHQANSQVFATCSHDNVIMTWLWLGTEAEDIDKVVVKYLSSMPFPRGHPVYQLCFLSKVPQRISQQGAQVMCSPKGSPVMAPLREEFAVTGLHKRGCDGERAYSLLQRR